MGAVMSQEKFYGFEFEKEVGGIKEFTMTSNGLTVLIKEDKTAPVATFMVTYRVGSVNEATGHTGATHLLEHLMFKGSKNYKNGKADVILDSIGARTNATTWTDRTNYFGTLPSNHLETIIKIEADRMRGAIIVEEDRQSEMTVVRNEFERGENSPQRVLDQHIWSMAFQAHPYHHSTIGWKSDIENMPIEKLKEFYDIYYWPNNATVSIVGDVDTKEGLALVKKYFGKIRRSKHEIPTVYTTEPEQEGQRRVVLNRAGQQGVVGVAFKSPPAADKDMAPMIVLGEILGSGKNSRFYKQITDKGLVTSISASPSKFKYEGLFEIYASLTPGTKHEKVEELILEVLEEVKDSGVKEKELQKAKTKLITSRLFSQDGSYAIASGLNEAIASGDWTLYTSYEEKIKKVTLADIKRVANKYLVTQKSTVGYFIPEVSTGGGLLKGASAHRHHNGPYYFKKEEDLKEAGGFFQKGVEFSEPTEGVFLYTLKRGKGVVTLNGSMLGGYNYAEQKQQVPSLVVSMLDQGTTNKTKFQISDELESVGARLDFGSGPSRVSFSAKFLSKDTDRVLGLMAEQLQSPSFNEEEFKKVKKRREASLKRAKESTWNNAFDDFLLSIYGDKHQNTPTDPEKAIKELDKIDIEDLKAFHKKNYGRGSMFIVAVGDVSHESLSKKIKKEFGGWKKSPLVETPENRTGTPTKKVNYISMKDKTSSDLLYGIALDINEDSPEFLPLSVATRVLGGSFTARLMRKVRVEDGLTYGVYSSITGTTNKSPGAWIAYGTYSPDLLKKGEVSMEGVIEMWIDSGITKEELSNMKSTIIGSTQVGYDTTSGISRAILSSVVNKGGVKYLDEYANKIESITLEEVNKAIKKHIKFNLLYKVAAGSIDQNGNPLSEQQND
ncbi:MAG: insulinase family protein [Flavobacteriia bacterium]|nr:insulinase family protein [Flavobacteriia bacterium]